MKRRRSRRRSPVASTVTAAKPGNTASSMISIRDGQRRYTADAWTPDRSVMAWIVVASKPSVARRSRVAVSTRSSMVASRGRPADRGPADRGAVVTPVIIGFGLPETGRRQSTDGRCTCEQPCCGSGVVEARETDDPVPGAGQILVRSLACGICASDLHFMDHPEGDADDDSGLSNHDPDADIVMGHEYCAEVVDYGPGTAAPLARRHAGQLDPGAARRRRRAHHRPEPRGARRLRRVLPADRGDDPGGADRPADELVAIADAISVGWSYVNAGGGHAEGGAAGHRVRRDRAVRDRVAAAARRRPDRRRRLRRRHAGRPRWRWAPTS